MSPDFNMKRDVASPAIELRMAPEDFGCADSPAQACARLGISIPTFYRLVRSGQLEAVKVGRRTLCTRQAHPCHPRSTQPQAPIQYDERRYKDCWRVEAMFCRLKDFAASLPTTTSSPETSSQP